jgi:hypothetical protein
MGEGRRMAPHALFELSLIVMGSISLLPWLVQSVAGTIVYDDEQIQHGEQTMTWLAYIANADFWNRTLQN